ncbi:MAG: hypothetical protein KA965_08920 [Butyrivibrio sp.]|nr:hypothetical protein [Butyrivibrio sp.]
MKAVVMELRGQKAAVLDMQGRVSIVKNHNYAVGQKLELSEEVLQDYKIQRKSKMEKPFFKRYAPQFAFCAVALFLTTCTITAYAMPWSTVTLDINPSIQYSLNIMNHVLSVKALNNDGTDIVSEVQNEVQGEKIEDAVAATLNVLQNKKYISTVDTPVIFSIESMKNDKTAIKNTLLSEVENWNNGKTEESVKATAIIVTKDLKKEAEEKNVSPGKIYLTDQLKDAILENSGFYENEWLQKSVKDVQEATAQKSGLASTEMQKSEQKEKSGPDWPVNGNTLQNSENAGNGAENQDDVKPQPDETKDSMGGQTPKQMQQSDGSQKQPDGKNNSTQSNVSPDTKTTGTQQIGPEGTVKQEETEPAGDASTEGNSGNPIMPFGSMPADTGKK